MKLRYSPTSPYVRKVAVTAIELGLAGRIERVPTNTQDPDSDLSHDTPLAKVPALVLDDGQALYDSPVICEYLDSLHDGLKIFPPTGAERWRALRQQALADGMLDAAILRLMENARRPAEFRWQGWDDHQKAKVARGLDSLEAEAAAAALDGPLTIGQITVGCTLGYLDFRYPQDAWRDGHPNLTAWYEGFAARASMADTVPHAP